MKKLISGICFVAMLLLPQLAGAQFINVGISPGMVIASYGRNSATQQSQLSNRIYPGVVIEGNYVLQGFPFPISGYNSFGIGLYSGGRDTIALQDGLGTVIERKLHMRDFQLRFGYEIPNGNEFFTAWLGWSAGIRSGRIKIVEARNTSGPVDPSSITFESRIFSPTIGVLAGAMYEFEHFFVFARYDFGVAIVDPIFGSSIHHQFHAGIYLPIYTF